MATEVTSVQNIHTVPLSKQIGVFFVIVGPTIGVVTLAWVIQHWWFSWFFLGMFVVSFLFAGFGATASLHRYLTHASFKATPFLEHLLLIQANWAVEGFPLHWVANHKKHHQTSDTEDDLHSPLVSFWHAHIGWFFRVPDADIQVYARHLLNRHRVLFWNRMFPVVVIASFVVPTLIGGVEGIIVGDGFLWGCFQGLLWGVLLRIFFVHHVTWSVNSACHLWGSQPYQTPMRDQSRNNWLVGILALGEGWHNNHHARDKSVQHGPWPLDFTLWYIKFWELLRQADNLRYFPKEEWERLRIEAA